MKRLLTIAAVMLWAGIACAQSSFKYNGLSYTSTGVTFANLGVTPPQTNGSLVYCSDCTNALPCAGGGTGAWAQRLNGSWNCLAGATGTVSANALIQGQSGAQLNGLTGSGANPGLTGFTSMTGPSSGLAITGGATTGADTINNFNVNGMVNVKAYGAKGDGVTDDAPAFRNAITALSTRGGTVIVPPSSTPYVWASEVHFPRNVILQGHSVDSSTINCTQNVGTTACAVWSDNAGTNAYRQGGARDITLEGPGKTTTTTGVYTGGDPAGVFSTSTDYGDSMRFDRVKVVNFGHGYSFGNNSFTVIWTELDLVGNGTGLYADLSTLTNAGENMNFVGGTIRNNSVNGINANMFAGSGLHFESVSIDYNAAPAIIGVNPNFVFTGCHFEQSTGDIIQEGTNVGGQERIVVNGGEMFLTAGVGTDPEMITITNGGSPTMIALTLKDVEVHALHAVTKLITNPSGWPVAESGLINADTNVADFATWASITTGPFGFSIVTNTGTGIQKVIDNFSEYLPPVKAVGSLETCSATTEGAHGVFNNCNAACTVGGTCTAGGTTHCEVYCNGTGWHETGN